MEVSGFHNNSTDNNWFVWWVSEVEWTTLKLGVIEIDFKKVLER